VAVEEEVLSPNTTDEGATDSTLEFDPMTHGLEDEDAPSDLVDPNVSPESDVPTPEVKVDEKGRVRAQDGKFAKKPEPKPTAPPETPESVPAPDEGPEAATPAPVEDAPKNQPWRPNVYGQEVELLPGALVSPDGHVFIPKDQAATLQALVARGTKYDEVKQMRQQLAKEREQMTAPLKAETQALAELLSSTLFDDNWMLQYAIDPDAAKREVSYRLREAQLTLREQFGQPSVTPPTPPSNGPSAPSEPLDPYDAELGLTGWLENDILSLPEYHGLFSASDKSAIVSRLMAVEPFAFVNGGWAIDQMVARQLIDALAEAPKRERAIKAQQEKDRKASEAARRNAAAVPKPTEPAKAAPTPKAATPNDDYADQPWNNPALDRHERAALYRKHLGVPSI
jgi:hypothetical protein